VTGGYDAAMDNSAPWWDGEGWRVDAPPPGVTPAPLAEDGTPLVPIPSVLRTSRMLTIVQGILLLAGAAILLAYINGHAGLAALAAVQAVLAVVLLLNGTKLNSLRPGPWRWVVGLESLLVAVGVLNMIAAGGPVGSVPTLLAVVVLVLLLRPPVREAMRMANSPVPSADGPRLPRPVDPYRLGKESGRPL
jgi:hypothetical protein